MRLGMEIELERSVMESIFQSHIIHRKFFFRFNEIAYLSGVNTRSLQRILPRLVNREWLGSIIAGSFSGGKPEGGIGYLLGFDDAKKENYRETRMKVGFPKEIIEEFKKELRKLAKEKLDTIPSSQEKERTLRKGRISGRTKLWKKIISKNVGKDYTFYWLIEYPFLYRIRGGLVPTNYDEKKVPEWKVPQGKKRFWKSSAKDMIYLIKKWNDVIPRFEVNVKQKINSARYFYEIYHKGYPCQAL